MNATNNEGIQSYTPKPQAKTESVCYHLWALAAQGNALFRRRRCFTSRAAANKAGSRTGFNVYRRSDGSPDVVVMKCREICPCRPECPTMSKSQPMNT